MNSLLAARLIRSALLILCSLIVTGDGRAQNLGQDPATPVRGTQLGPTRVRHLKVGLRIKAVGPCRGIRAAIPVPMDWPEQQVRIIDTDVSTAVRSVKYRELGEGVKQMLITIPRMNANDEVHATLTLEIDRQPIIAPVDTQVYKVPKRPARNIRKYLGSSPFIESRNARIRGLARKILADKKDETAWAQVEAIYDYVRENVEYRESELKGAIRTLSDGVGDCEAMTSLFIALCRAAKIPSRMVWVTDHSYPEFYLEDEEGQGHWFPCQISGSKAFGSMPEVRPILQKGDNFAIPETRERRRYVATQLKAASVRGGAPQITEILEFVDPQSTVTGLP